MATLLDEFRSITGALGDAGIDYAVCGGWAMAIHGLPRATMDIDLLIRPDDLARARDLARSFGYDVEGLPLHFDDGAVEIRRISKVDQESKQLFTLDFLLVTEWLQDVWELRKKVSWVDGAAWVVSPDGLIKLKLLAGRKQDLADIEKLRESENES
jgi:hypothetical protein